MDKSEQPTDVVSLTRVESMVLSLLRANKYSRVEIQIKNGTASRIYVDEEISPGATTVEDIIRSNAFQTITITEHGGYVVRITRTIPIKF